MQLGKVRAQQENAHHVRWTVLLSRMRRQHARGAHLHPGTNCEGALAVFLLLQLLLQYARMERKRARILLLRPRPVAHCYRQGADMLHVRSQHIDHPVVGARRRCGCHSGSFSVPEAQAARTPAKISVQYTKPATGRVAQNESIQGFSIGN